MENKGERGVWKVEYIVSRGSKSIVLALNTHTREKSEC